MQVLIKFNTKSTSSVIGKSIKLAQELNGQLSSENNKIMVVEGEHKTQNLTKLLGQVIGLAKTEVFLDGEHIATPKELYDVLSCTRRAYCDGHCIVGDPVFNDLFCELGVAENPYSHFHLSRNEYYIKKLYEEASQIIDSDSKSELTINIALLIKAYEKSMQSTQKACEVFNAQVIISKLKTLPTLVVLKKDSYEYEDQIDEEEMDLDNYSMHTNIGDDQMRKISIIFADEIEARIRNILDEMGLLKKS